MDRIEKIRKYLTPYIVGRVREKIGEASKIQGDDLIPAVRSLLRCALDRQEKQPQWKPSQMGLFHLMSSLLTESYEYELLLADQQLYLDGFQVTGFWNPEFLYRNEQEETYVQKELNRRFIRLNSYEISYAKRFVFYEYRSIAGVYFKERLDEITGLEEFQLLKKEKPFQFLHGDYMGDMHIIRQDKEGL